jgi:glycerol uptake facilitator protein
VITTAWALAVFVGAYSVAAISGAHLNPAVTIGLVVAGKFEAAMAPMYIGAQFIGAFIGAVLVFLHYYPHWAETSDPGLKLAVFSTGPRRCAVWRGTWSVRLLGRSFWSSVFLPLMGRS